MGALTTMNGEVIERSRTGRHWTERREVDLGDEFDIINISNSGKHSCHRVRVIQLEPEVKTEVIKCYVDEHGYCEICSR
jgi:hypothetical protein